MLLGNSMWHKTFEYAFTGAAFGVLAYGVALLTNHADNTNPWILVILAALFGVVANYYIDFCQAVMHRYGTWVGLFALAVGVLIVILTIPFFVSLINIR